MPLCNPLWGLLFWLRLGSSVFVPSSPSPPPFAGCFVYLSLPGFHQNIFFFFLKTQITNTHIPISEKQCNNCKFCFVPDHVTSFVEPGSSRYIMGLKPVQSGGSLFYLPRPITECTLCWWPFSFGDKWFTKAGFDGCLIPLATEAQFQCLPNWYQSCLGNGFNSDLVQSVKPMFGQC